MRLYFEGLCKGDVYMVMIWTIPPWSQPASALPAGVGRLTGTWNLLRLMRWPSKPLGAPHTWGAATQTHSCSLNLCLDAHGRSVSKCDICSSLETRTEELNTHPKIFTNKCWWSYETGINNPQLAEGVFWASWDGFRLNHVNSLFSNKMHYKYKIYT